MADFRVDEKFLEDVGINIKNATQKTARIKAIKTDLEQRVGYELANAMNDDELDEFEVLIDNGDEDKMLAWLENFSPDYSKIVEKHYKIIRAELKAKGL